MMIELLFYLALIIVAVSALISVFNLFTAPMFANRKNESTNEPFISVLIPARNEERNIGNCIDVVLSQSYKNFELIILDDESEDKTAEIISDKISEYHSNNKIKLISGKPLPNGWLGKNWACHQLSQEARGDYLLFLDADVRVKPNVLESCVYYQNKYGLQMITCFPTQLIKSFGEWLVVPLMNFLLLAFLPLRKVYSSPNKSFVAANGQFLFIDRNTYEKIGGHSAFADRVVEDMEIAREVKKAGFKLITFLGGSSISCRMYEGFTEAFNGFSKNFFPGFNIPAILFFFLLIILFLAFLLPFTLIFMNPSFLIIVLIVMMGRLFISIPSRQNLIINILLHPIQILIMLAIGVNSIYRIKTKKLKWKGRYI
ncbi:MAG TPA: glycosyltransferase family 2 protein [Ignavibacteriaceae bacterium]|nr:glycosyltransferase family 2 protein [Ignavibacteriaceae bacterium]